MDKWIEIDKVQNRKIKIEYYQEVESTNTLLQMRAGQEEMEEFHTIVANYQSAGIGRYGRRFDSPKDTGVYLSTLLKPKELAGDTIWYITIAAAVAVCRAIESISGKRCEIKWVNDIYIDGKKVAGILAQGQVDNSSGQLNQIILGVGVNVYQPIEGFAPEIQSRAGYVLERSDGNTDVKEKYISSLLRTFYQYYMELDSKAYIEEYISRSMLIGREVEVIQNGHEKTARVLKINSDCNLVVQYEDETIEVLLCGEVSLKL